MSIDFISPAAWHDAAPPIASSGEWLAITGRKDDRLASTVADACPEPGSTAADVVILRRGVVGRMADLLNSLPGSVSTFAVPVAADDLMLVRPTAVSQLRSSAAGTSLAEWLCTVAGSGVAMQWQPVPHAAADDRLALPALAPAPPATDQRWQLDAVRALVASHPQAGVRAEAKACEAALLLLNDWLDESHRASQSIEGEGRDHNGDYWHAIMHRREPDYGNSKYWYRHVGRHPIFPALAEAAGEVLGSGPVEIAQTWRKRLITRGQWDPFACVDLCEEAARDEASPLGLTARRIQFAEMLLLLVHTWKVNS